ncbi:hydroxysqualene dehydroxylase [Microvirga puerhi]|uniref:FAD-dependent oxidoreductase n=1 Tax=Microvirga puerhi TaxID=2876078 RepID=A0ABS7VTX7_9HYPH|nr:FAD-dependent oxidoreductase [Microvirga puerhi]MBZ6079019.1 FAD-dependent oxidoreductase [Microvirga puerhi]
MTMKRTHIVGAGIAGLSAALAATDEDGEAVLYEAAPQAGGRCRTLYPPDGFVHDNGTHVLFTANRRALAFLRAIGATHRWAEPEPGGVPIYNRRTERMRRVGLSPWSWLFPSRCPEGLGPQDLGRILRLILSSCDRPVASVIGERPIMESLIEPLTVAVLNTPAAEASSKRLGRTLRLLLRPGASKLLVARCGLNEDLVAPALTLLQARGVRLLTSQRLRSVLVDNGRATGLALADRIIALGPSDQVVLALPPWEIARLLPTIPVPCRFEPILNFHYPLRGPDRPRFIGLIGTLAQWALIRRDHVSVTVSAADAVIDRDVNEVAAQIWREIAPALAALGLNVDVDRQPRARVVKEKRATIRQAAGPLPQPPVRPLVNLALAGDWIGYLPATIESAITAGEDAISALRDRHVKLT